MSQPFPTAPVTLTGTYVALEQFTPQLQKGKLVVQFGDGTTGFPLVAGPTGPPGAASTVPGPQGPQGQPGAPGAAGAQGAASTVAGPQGPQGPQGPAGTGGGGTALAVDGGTAALNGSESLDGGGAAG